MDAKKYKHTIQGRRSKENGTIFENIITTACHYYIAKGTALILKTPEPMKPTKDLGNGKFIAYYEKRAQPDYKGVLKGGRTVVFEAKHTDSDRLLQSAVTEHQAKSLTLHEQLGAECFVLVSFSFLVYYKIPWATFKAMKEVFGRKYIKPTDLKEYRIPYVEGVLRFLN